MSKVSRRQLANFFLSAEKMDLKLVLHASVQNSSRQIVKWAHGVWKSPKKVSFYNFASEASS